VSATAAEPAPLTPLELELEEVRERFPNASMRQVSGQWLVSVPEVPAPPGWTKSVVTLHFFVSAAYPHANPDCFYADGDLRLANGNQPQNSGPQHVDGVGTLLWFSYHLARPWKAGRDRLQTWIATILGRLADVR
jgi:E2/UBC family protein E